MAITGSIKPLKDKHGNYIFPETSSEAVYCSDGVSIEKKNNKLEQQISNVEKLVEEHIQNSNTQQNINADTIDGLHFKCLTKEEYDLLPEKDINTLYFIKEV